MPNIPYFKNWSSMEVQPSVRVNSVCGKFGLLNPHLDSSIENVWHLFMHGLAASGELGNCFGWRSGNQYSFLSFGDIRQRVIRLSKALRQVIGVKANEDLIGLYAASSPQWMICALACAYSSVPVVPLYDTLGADSCSYIISETEMNCLFVDTVSAAVKIVEELASNEVSATALQTIVTIGSIGQFDGEKIPDEVAAKGVEQGISVINISDLLKDISSDYKRLELPDRWLPSANDIYMVQYTSGTSGNPKGVLLTHRNMASNCATVTPMVAATTGKRRIPLDGYEVGLTYLPLAHSYGQVFTFFHIYHGFSVAFFSGNLQKLTEDAQICRPTIMPLVPRLMNKVYSKVMADVKSKGRIASRIFWLAYAKKQKMLHNGIYTKSSIWDKLVFKKIQDRLGGRVEFMITASAPVSGDVLEFWRVAMGAHIFEAYGQTECTALVTAAVHPSGDNVGHPVTCNKIKLVDNAENGYFVKDQKGELCVKGSNVMKGYFKQPELTSATLDADGWLHTGDIGQILSDGSLRIIDRKNNIFKLAQGEYIAPEKIESVYSKNPLIAQIFVHGNSMQWFTVAIVVPEEIEAEKWAKNNNIEFISLSNICKNEDFARFLLDDLLQTGCANGLNQLEQVKAIHLHPDLFSVENKLLTPTMKNKRSSILSHFSSHLEKLYERGPMIKQSHGKRK